VPRHRAPREHLPGDAAGGRPGWEGRLLALVETSERQKAATKGNGQRYWPVRMVVTSDIEFRRMLNAAAAARGISASGYVRRAVAAFVAADLDLDFAAVVVHTPRAVPTGGAMSLPPEQHPRLNPGPWPDDGTGYGPWDVVR
jgi:hypothetical protein